jgi:hypothetical protein
VENTSWDDLDRQLVHALTVTPRAPFKQIADVLGVSDQTIARRFRKLTATASLVVRGMVNGIRSVETAPVIGTAKRTMPGGVAGGGEPRPRSGLEPRSRVARAGEGAVPRAL